MKKIISKVTLLALAAIAGNARWLRRMSAA